MKTALLAAGLALAATIGITTDAAHADDSTLYAGFAWTVHGGPGLTVKYLSTNNPNDIGLAAGVTYNFDGKLGCDVGASAADSSSALVFSYDLCRRSAQISAGALTNPR